MLTAELSEDLERLQRKTKVIFGDKVPYREAVQRASIERLDERREAAVEKFAQKQSENPKFAEKWFPKNEMTGRRENTTKTYVEERSYSDRLQRAPIFDFRRRLNAKESPNVPNYAEAN